MAEGLDANLDALSESNLPNLEALHLEEIESESDAQHSQDSSDDESSSNDDDINLEVRTPEAPFNPRQCLFCKSYSTGFDENLEHMTKKHGLSILERNRLIVDLVTLIEYFHLIIFGYFECLYCGSQRQSFQGAQQHMLGKAHCKIDIAKENSEFRDFYGSEDNEDITKARESWIEMLKTNSIDDDKTIRFASGKIAAKRGHATSYLGRQKETKLQTQPTMADIQENKINSSPSHTASADSKRVVKREAQFQTQLASLRAADRASLMHLPTWKQRALVLESKKQVARARKEENEMLLKIQLKANKTLKK
ncbi:hypothetical protein QQS21_011195 [Conoideocrella luteorostrata]|uniref:ZN622/Rei1/Reh1 zinc finger C2H2-type domain-containing protein n=1 Tax=Conoideocrella luteorostrata TaxID=1105319 RepID=A0AAJ0CEL1_9HYPO|nr:hypothetical protein QQS21_011195 [Conoideocrella luteorostrata]